MPKKERIHNLPIDERQNEFIRRCEEKHGKTYDYSKVVYETCHSKVIIICSKHGEFIQFAFNHINGKGCRKCTIPASRRRITKEEFLSRANEKHGDLYDYSKMDYIDITTSITITCKMHGDFNQVPIEHLRGGCVKCANSKSAIARTLTNKEFIERALLVHNDRYDYSKVVYETTHSKVIIICPDHGEFIQSPNSHLNGRGCIACKNIKSSSTHRSTTEKFIEKAIRIHGDSYIYDKVVYTDATNKVIIICREHGEFEQTPKAHLKGRRCISCSHRVISVKRKYTREQFIEAAKAIHGDTYLYDKVVYSGSNDKVIITCRIHGDFNMIPLYHINYNSGCKQCVYKNKASKLSFEWLNMLKCTHPKLMTAEYPGGEYRIPTTRYSADGYCPDTNTIFEFHGDYWHGNPARYSPDVILRGSKVTMGELYQRTVKKKQDCEALGYRYVELWESEWITLKKLLRRQMRMRMRAK